MEAPLCSRPSPPCNQPCWHDHRVPKPGSTWRLFRGGSGADEPPAKTSADSGVPLGPKQVPVIWDHSHSPGQAVFPLIGSLGPIEGGLLNGSGLDPLSGTTKPRPLGPCDHGRVAAKEAIPAPMQPSLTLAGMATEPVRGCLCSVQSGHRSHRPRRPRTRLQDRVCDGLKMAFGRDSHPRLEAKQDRVLGARLHGIRYP